MTKDYGSQKKNIVKATIDDITLLEIGRLIRACAEIEDMVNLHICQMTSLSEGQLSIFLGRTPAARRVEVARTLANNLGANAVNLHKLVFSKQYAEIVLCRNAVAHGTLLGKTDENELCFMPASVEAAEEGVIHRQIIAYKPEIIKNVARMAESSIPRLEKLLNVGALREERLLQPLSPHPKSQRQKSVEPRTPPQSSRG